jgi:hypothetical protein
MDDGSSLTITTCPLGVGQGFRLLSKGAAGKVEAIHRYLIEK